MVLFLTNPDISLRALSNKFTQSNKILVYKINYDKSEMMALNISENLKQQFVKVIQINVKIWNYDILVLNSQLN